MQQTVAGAGTLLQGIKKFLASEGPEPKDLDLLQASSGDGLLHHPQPDAFRPVDNGRGFSQEIRRLLQQRAKVVSCAPRLLIAALKFHAEEC